MSTIFGFMPPVCLGSAYFFRVIFLLNLQNVRIERELIKHTFLFHFLRCVNVICVNITNLSLNAFSH